ncbi:MAG: class I SAM-dependent methyltransferase [Bacteroidales bacterium]|nr:class I SAM-dependent methyltransferase [Bacteroidales bacterium]
MEKVYVKCNYCGADDYKVVFPEGKAQLHQIVKCNHCGLMYANPQTTHTVGGKVSLDEGLNDNIEELEKELADFIPDKNQYLKKQYIQQKDYLKVLDYIDNRPKGTLLDIGSYTGVFLNSAKERGWDTLGIEPLTKPRLYSEKEFGLKVLSTPFEKSDIADGSIDVVVYFHVIEHVYDPKAFILKSHQVLKKGGLLVMETPTYDSFMFKLLRHRERSARCDGHIFLFTTETLSKLVESCGFKVVKHDKVGRTLSVDRLFHNFGIITGCKKFFNFIATKLRLDKFTIHLNMRDMQRIYCEKL